MVEDELAWCCCINVGCTRMYLCSRFCKSWTGSIVEVWASDLLTARQLTSVDITYLIRFLKFYYVLLLEHIQYIENWRPREKNFLKYTHLLCVCGMGRKSDCVWRSEAEAMFQTARHLPETLPNFSFHSGADFNLPCFEIKPIKMAKVADVHCGSVRCMWKWKHRGADEEETATGCFDWSITPRSCA